MTDLNVTKKPSKKQATPYTMEVIEALQRCHKEGMTVEDVVNLVDNALEKQQKRKSFPNTETKF